MADTGNAGAGTSDNVRRSSRNRPPTPQPTTAAETEVVPTTNPPTSNVQDPIVLAAPTVAPVVTPSDVGGVTQAFEAWSLLAPGGSGIGQPGQQLAESNEDLRNELLRLKTSLAWFHQHPAYQAFPPPMQFPPPQPQTALLLPAQGNTNPLINYQGDGQNILERPTGTAPPQVTLPQSVTQTLPPYVIPFGTAPHYTPGISMAVSQAGTYPPIHPGAQPSLYQPLPPPQGYPYGAGLQGYPYGVGPHQPWPGVHGQYLPYNFPPLQPEMQGWPGLDTQSKGKHPFVSSIMREYVPVGFQMPFEITPYGGDTDPQDHINTFNSAMTILGMSDGQQCRIFSSTLKGAALRWFSLLPPNTIYTFEQLATLFAAQFASSKEYKKTEETFIGFYQGDNESLQDFLARFSKLALQVRGLRDEVALYVLKQGLKSSPFFGDINRNPPRTLAELMARAEKFIVEENAHIAKKHMREFLKGKGKKDKASAGDEKESGDRRERNQRKRSPARSFAPLGRYTSYTPLNKSQRGVLEEIYTSDVLRFPAPPKKRKVGPTVDQAKYCQFHRDSGHDTNECITLKDQIEDLIRRGKLSRYVKRSERSTGRRQEKEAVTDEEPRGVIDVIAGGIQKGTSTQSQSRKKIEKSILALEYLAKDKSSPPTASISFDCTDAVDPSHDDPMVISAIVANFEVKRVLVDQGSSADIMYYDTYKKLGLEERELKPFPGTLIGFSGAQVSAEGSLRARITIGTPPKAASAQVDFIIVSAPSAYNIILGRPSLNKLRAIVSTAHLIMKFPTEHGTGEVKADRKLARTCYATSLTKILKTPKERETGKTQEGKQDGSAEGKEVAGET